MLKQFRKRRQWLRNYNQHRLLLKQNINKLSGQHPPAIAPDEMIVTLLVRNGETRISKFIEHHRKLGAKHQVILDNGSTDSTVCIASQHDDVTIYHTVLPFKQYKQYLRAWLRKTFCSDGWVLNMDVDEKFRYPLDTQLALEQFLTYLNKNAFTAVRAEMLDFFPLAPASQWEEDGYAEWYDISDVEWLPTRKGCYAFGGIRKNAFGITPLLTKHPLIRFSKGARPSLKDSHTLVTGKVADITTVLKHYKFDKKFAKHCEEAVNEGNYYNNSIEYKDYLAGMNAKSDFCFQPQKPVRFTDVDKLIEEGFLTVSRHYRNFVNQLNEKNTA